MTLDKTVSNSSNKPLPRGRSLSVTPEDAALVRSQLSDAENSAATDQVIHAFIRATGGDLKHVRYSLHWRCLRLCVLANIYVPSVCPSPFSFLVAWNEATPAGLSGWQPQEGPTYILLAKRGLQAMSVGPVVYCGADSQ
jgi:hypothetical protein